MIIYRATRYRIYPTAEQEARLRRWQDALRFLWNLAHEQRLMGLARPKDERRFVKYIDQQAELTQLRAELPWLAEVPCCACQGILRELDKAWERAFKSISQQPRWKRKSRRGCSIVASVPSFRVDSDRITFPKLGAVPAVIHRELRGKAKTIRLVRDVDQWFAIVSTEIEAATPAPSSLPPVGIDRGVVNILADSTGRLVENPQYLNRMAARIARAQRSAARKKGGSKNRYKAIDKVARLHRKVRRQRDHLLQAESKRYAKSHGVVVLEKLNLQAMTASAKGTIDDPGTNVSQKAGLNRAIRHAAWGCFADLLRYKLTEHGGIIIEVMASYSSQTCSACGSVDAENRRSRSDFACTVCGHREDADVNAAKVILSRGLLDSSTKPLAKDKKTLRILKRKRKDDATAVVPTVEACGGDGVARP